MIKINKTGLSKEKRTKTVTFNFSESMVDKLKTLSDQSGLTRTDILEIAINQISVE